MMGDSFDAGLRAPPAPNVGVCTLLAARKESKDCLGDSMSLGWAIFRDFFRCMDGYTGGSRAEDKLDFRRQPQRHKCSLWTRWWLARWMDGWIDECTLLQCLATVYIPTIYLSMLSHSVFPVDMRYLIWDYGDQTRTVSFHSTPWNERYTLWVICFPTTSVSLIGTCGRGNFVSNLQDPWHCGVAQTQHAHIFETLPLSRDRQYAAFLWWWCGKRRGL